MYNIISNAQLEAMVRLLNLSQTVAQKLAASKQLGLSNAIMSDIKLLAEFGAQQTATTPAEEFETAKRGISVEKNWTKILRDANIT